MKIKQLIYLITLSMLLLLSSCFDDTECKHENTTWIIDVEATCTTKGMIFKNVPYNEAMKVLNIIIESKIFI